MANRQTVEIHVNDLQKFLKIIGRSVKTNMKGMWFTASLTEQEIKKLTKNQVWVEI